MPQEGIEYRHDQTNEEIIYTRNRVRHMLIPMIEEHFNPSFSSNLTRMGISSGMTKPFKGLFKDAFDRDATIKEDEISFSLRDLNIPKQSGEGFFGRAYCG